MTSAESSLGPLGRFVRPMIGLPAWGAKQGHGSFLTFEFGEPKLEVHEPHSKEKGLQRSVNVGGQWHLWIYCCHWRVLQHGEQLAWSEDEAELIGRAADALNGQKLLAMDVEPAQGRSSFTFDLGGLLETWPFGDGATYEQWMILTDKEAFAYRSDGFYQHGPSNTPPDMVRWLPLG